MLSQSHPTYLSHLRLSVSKSKSGSDKAIALLTVISMAILVMQAVIGEWLLDESALLVLKCSAFFFFSFFGCAGINSMNVNLPHDPKGEGTFHVFGIVLAISVFVLFLYGCIVRWWWVSASRRSSLS
jgi:magnesium transporter